MSIHLTLDEFLMNRLSDPYKAFNYLQVSLEEYLNDGDLDFFMEGIKNIVNAQGGIENIANPVGISPKFLSDAIYQKRIIPYDVLNLILSHFKKLNDVNLKLMIYEKPLDVAKTSRATTPKNKGIKKDMSNRQLQNIRYWETLSKRFDDKDSIKIFKPDAYSYLNYQYFKTELPGILLRARQTIRYSEISSSLAIRGKNSVGYFYSFRTQQDSIEKEFGNKLEWHAKGEREKRIDFKNDQADPNDENDWQNQHDWFSDTFNRIYDVFKPIIRELKL